MDLLGVNGSCLTKLNAPPALQGSVHITNYCVLLGGKSYYLDYSSSGSEAGSAVNQAAALEQIIEKYDLRDKFAGLVTDTPNVMQVLMHGWECKLLLICLWRHSISHTGSPCVSWCEEGLLAQLLYSLLQTLKTCCLKVYI